MNVVIVLFDGITALDAIGPYEVLSRIPSARVTFAAPSAGVVRTGEGGLGLVADVSLDSIARCDVMLVPGGVGTRALERDECFLAWIRSVDATTRLTTSVCTGAFVLAAAGLLRGRRANTHWAFRDRLATYGAIPVGDRVVRDGKYASAAGVSAGIDLALSLAIELAGETVAAAIQLGVEYDPSPPLDAGDASPCRSTGGGRRSVSGWGLAARHQGLHRTVAAERLTDVTIGYVRGDPRPSASSSPRP